MHPKPVRPEKLLSAEIEHRFRKTIPLFIQGPVCFPGLPSRMQTQTAPFDSEKWMIHVNYTVCKHPRQKTNHQNASILGVKIPLFDNHKCISQQSQRFNFALIVRQNPDRTFQPAPGCFALNATSIGYFATITIYIFMILQTP